MVLQTIVQAVNQTLRDEMRRNGNMVVLGEDVGRDGGVFRATEGLLDEFGGERVVDTPLAEDAIVGMAIGMALYGLQPVAEIQFLDFIYPAFNEIVNELAKFRYRSGGQFPAHIVIRTPYGGGVRGGHYHSQSTEAYFIHTPGLVVLAPSTPYDTKGLLLSAMRSPDPVIFLEPKRIYRTVREEVPAEEYLVPIGKAKVVQEGSDLTLVSWGAMVQTCREAVGLAAKENLSIADRPAVAPPLRHRDSNPVGEEDREGGCGPRGDEDSGVRRRDLRADQREGHRLVEGPDRESRRLRHAVPLRPGERLHAFTRKNT